MTTKILVVDDDPAVGAATRGLLRRIFPDAEILSAASAPEGLALVGKESPRAIVLDHMMPKMDGMEFLRALRGHECGEAIPVLAYSAYRLQPIYEGERRVEFLRKPATMDQLKEAMIKLLLKKE